MGLFRRRREELDDDDERVESFAEQQQNPELLAAEAEVAALDGGSPLERPRGTLDS